MTTTKTVNEPTDTAANSVWADQLAALKDRFPKVRDTILFAYHVLQTDPDIAIDDLKAQAQLHGLRLTTATESAARRLLARNAASDGGTATPTRSPVPAKRPRTRQRRAARAPLDIESVIRDAVAKVEEDRAAEAGELREAIRKAMAVLGAVVGR